MHRRLGLHEVAARLLSVVALAGCAGTSVAGTPPPAPVPEARLVVLRDFAITTEAEPLAPGRAILRLQNEGPTVHELLLVRTEQAAAALALSADGLSADENGLDIVTTDESVHLGSTDTLTADLAPGHYALLCNLSGHYGSGMHTDLLIGPPR